MDKIFPRGKGGVGEALKIAFPLVIASLGHALNLFTDRVMLAAYSHQAMAAAFPSGLTAFTLSCIFLGAVGYAGVFVAQYTGAKQMHQVSESVWQAIFLALLGGTFMAVTCFWAEEIFAFFGHAQELQPLETSYFRILVCFGYVPLLSAALSVFWSGQAKTNMIMVVNLIITLVNIPLNYLLIFGASYRVMNWNISIPEMGINGAAWGTIGAGAVGLLIYFLAFISPENRKTFGTLRYVWNGELFVKLLRFGAPNGIQLVLDLATFNIFIVLLGKISEPVLTASGVVFSAYSLAFNPMIGCGQAAAIMVGQNVGAKDIPAAERSIRSVRFLLYIYSLVMLVICIFFPELVYKTFSLADGEVKYLTRIMLMFTAAYLFFDAMNVLFSNAVKGAGDTWFVMISGLLLGWLAFALPCAGAYWFFSGEYAIEKWGEARAQSWNIWTLWTILDIYIFLLGITFYYRYKCGKWKKMSVI
ncbi:MAG: MATE family efflux transporter [Lentisphaeria bacterium]|nr:MATE family efflux transporter [Lentisphaeria bacterium]